MKPLHRNAAGTALLALLCAALVVGCSKHGSPTSSAGLDAGSGTSSASGTAATAFDALSRDLQVADSLTHGPCNPFGLPLRIPSGCAFDAATVSFLCTDAHDGLTDVHGYQFLDAAGVPQAAYDSVATASIRFQSHLSGVTTRGPSSIVDDERALVESGMAGDEASRTWNGSGSSSRQDSVRAPDGSLLLVHRVSSTAVADVVVPKPWAPDSWPLRGTITTHLLESGGRASLDLTSVLTFNGTRFATLAVGDSTFTVDLMAPPRGGSGDGPGGAAPPPPGGGPPPPPPGNGPPPPPPGGGTGGGAGGRP